MKSKNNKLICTMIDPMGPVKWLDDNRIIGRQNFGERNNLMVVDFVGGSEVGVCISAGFEGAINKIEVGNGGDTVKVTSNFDEKVTVVNLSTFEVVLTDEYGEFSITRLLSDLAINTAGSVSPDGTKIIKRIGKMNPPQIYLEIGQNNGPTIPDGGTCVLT